MSPLELQARAQALFTVFDSNLGGIVGSLHAGFIAQASGIAQMYRVSSIFALIAMALLILGVKEKAKQIDLKKMVTCFERLC